MSYIKQLNEFMMDKTDHYDEYIHTEEEE